MGERYQLLEAGVARTQWIAMKFGMFFVGQKENALSIDDLTQRETFFFRDTVLDSASHFFFVLVY